MFILNSTSFVHGIPSLICNMSILNFISFVLRISPLRYDVCSRWNTEGEFHWHTHRLHHLRYHTGRYPWCTFMS
jgi:hypothetical protein